LSGGTPLLDVIADVRRHLQCAFDETETTNRKGREQWRELQIELEKAREDARRHAEATDVWKRRALAVQDDQRGALAATPTAPPPPAVPRTREGKGRSRAFTSQWVEATVDAARTIPPSPRPATPNPDIFRQFIEVHNDLDDSDDDAESEELASILGELDVGADDMCGRPSTPLTVGCTSTRGPDRSAIVASQLEHTEPIAYDMDAGYVLSSTSHPTLNTPNTQLTLTQTTGITGHAVNQTWFRPQLDESTRRLTPPLSQPRSSC
jgi:hypothetical protein